MISGLSAREAEAARQKYGLNERTVKIDFGTHLAYGMLSLSAKLLLIGAMVKAVIFLLALLEVIAVTPDYSGIIFLASAAILCGLLESVISFMTEKRMTEVCRKSTYGEYAVLRDGKAQRISEELLTVGDVVFLSKGDYVPADGTVAEGMFTVDQSDFGMLEKIEKTTPPSNFHGRNTGLKSPYNLYCGSVICEGGGAMKITAIGENTLIAENELILPDSGFHTAQFDKINLVGAYAGAGMAIAVITIFAIMGGLSGQLFRGILEGMSAAAAVLAVACICGKNLLVRFSASCVMKKLSRRGVAAASSELLENISTVDTLIIGRTGMLTDGVYRVGGFIDGNGSQIESIDSIDKKVLELFKAAVVNTSSANICEDTVFGGTAADRAILEYIMDSSDGKMSVKKQSETRRAGLKAVTVSLDGKLVTFLSGGADNLLSRCADGFSADGKKRRITNKDALSKLAATISLTGNDVRAYAVCEREIKGGKLPEGAYTLIGMTAFSDKVFGETSEALETLKKCGVRTIMVTSASRETAIYTQKKAGWKTKGVILDSFQLSKMKNAELERRIEDIRAVVGASSEDKKRLMRIANERQMKVCAVCSDYDDMHMFDTAEAAVASPVSMSALRKLSDGTAKGCGIKAAAELFACSKKFFTNCKILLGARIVCTVLFAALAVISVIGW